MRRVETLHNILEIAKTSFYQCGANGDRYILASLSRLITLSYQFDSANYSLLQAERLYRDKDSDEILSLYQLQNSIISYCGCYDTLLEVLYFAFKFCKKLDDKEDFTEALKQCRWNVDGNASHLSLKNNLEGLLPNDKIAALIKKLDSFMNKSRQQVATLANHLKHGGGLITSKYATYISHIGYVNEKYIMTKGKKNNDVDIKFQAKSSFFDAEWLYPHIIDIPMVIGQMYQQNEAIYKMVVYVYNLLGYDKLNDTIADNY